MGYITKEGEYRVKVSINNVDLKEGELRNLFCHFELGNKMAWCQIDIFTKRKDVYRQCLFEMSIIEVELQSIDKNNATIDKKKMRYFLANNSIELNFEGNEKQYFITVIGVADAWKYLGYPNIQSADDRLNSPRFLSKLIYFKEQGAKGTGSFKLDIKDGLRGKATDWMYWLQSDINGIELVNQILLRPILKTNTNKLNPNRNYVYTSLVDFDESGNPTLTFYDILLRTQSFSPKSVSLPSNDGYGSQSLSLKFSFQDKGKITYSHPVIDIKGAEYSALYWQRSSVVYDTEEGEFIVRRVKQPKLFPDSMKYGSQKVFDGNGGNTPSEYTLFTNYERWNMEWYSTNHYNQHYALQKFQITANLLALRKINVTMTFRNLFIKAKPIDICEVEIQEGSEDKNINKIDKKLSGRYMITKVVFGIRSLQLFTTITASRDSFVA